MANLVAMQMVSGPDVDENLAVVSEWVAKQAPGSLVVLPECFACFGAGDAALLNIRETLGEGKIQSRLSQLAKQHQVHIIGGTQPLFCDDPGRYSASSLYFNDQGERVADYQKIHLFDVDIEDNTGSYRESTYTQGGSNIVVVDTPFGRLGMAVCYDLRFAGLFQAMGQIDVLVLPSAFTRRTGQAHWHSLLAARAIEKQCYVVAANQGGVHANGRETYGHSCIYSPWGVNLSQIEQGVGVAQANMDRSEIEKVRRSMPVYQHNKFRSHFV